jgi:hypothetical protein
MQKWASSLLGHRTESMERAGQRRSGPAVEKCDLMENDDMQEKRRPPSRWFYAIGVLTIFAGLMLSTWIVISVAGRATADSGN